MRRNRTALMLAGACILAAPALSAQHQRPVSSSLLLLIDASGSMGDPVGAGNPQVKIEAAKRAATDALSRAAGGGSVEVAVLAFSGDCQNPVPQYQDFTRDVDRLARFIDSLQAGGGTPMADALLFANRYMQSNGSARTSDRMIMLLADGQNDCGDVNHALATLQSSGVIFRHETVGFGITPNSVAAQDLRQVATETGGTYHHAADASQLADVFMEFVDTLSVIDMLGRFGPRAGATSDAPATAAAAPANESASVAGQQPADRGRLTSMLGSIRARRPAEGAATAPSGTADAQEYYVAAATTVGLGQHFIEPGFTWHFGTGWSRSSGHEAELKAHRECRRGSDSRCWNSSFSMLGGCVVVVEGTWFDKDDERQRLDISIGTGQFRAWIEQTTLDECETSIHAGKPDGTVEVYECSLKVSYCSEDVRP